MQSRLLPSRARARPRSGRLRTHPGRALRKKQTGVDVKRSTGHTHTHTTAEQTTHTTHERGLVGGVLVEVGLCGRSTKEGSSMSIHLSIYLSIRPRSGRLRTRPNKALRNKQTGHGGCQKINRSHAHAHDSRTNHSHDTRTRSGRRRSTRPGRALRKKQTGHGACHKRVNLYLSIYLYLYLYLFLSLSLSIYIYIYISGSP